MSSKCIPSNMSGPDKTRSFAYPRAALAGNPSDGYYGKTLGFCFNNFVAQTCLTIDKSDQELDAYTCFYCEDIQRISNNGTLSVSSSESVLVQAAIIQFKEYCQRHNLELRPGPFALGFKSDIPQSVGLGGSSAIILACFRALMQYFGADIPLPVLANQVLESETRQLGIAAGLQDRVVQTYQGLIYMDFDRELMESRQYGQYEFVECKDEPVLYIAYRTDLSVPSQIVHGQLRDRWMAGDPQILRGLVDCAKCAQLTYRALQAGESEQLHKSIDRNFDCRVEMGLADEGDIELVGIARSTGVAANQAGSGGAITGVVKSLDQYRSLKEKLKQAGAKVIRPRLASPIQVEHTMSPDKEKKYMEKQ